MAYSPNEGNYLAIGTIKGELYIHSVKDKYKRLSVLKGAFSNPIKAIDWDVKSEFLQIASNTDEYGFVEFSKGRVVEDPNLVKNVVWNSITCKFGWHVQVSFYIKNYNLLIYREFIWVTAIQLTLNLLQEVIIPNSLQPVMMMDI